MLTVTDVAKRYPTPRGLLTVLTDVSFSMQAGEAAAITGPSGSGKSSLLYVLGALEPPSDGTVVLDGRNPFSLSPKALADFRNREIGFVFQDHCLLPQCSVLENVLVPTLVATPNGTGDDPAQRARALVERVGLADRLDHRPAELSGGEKQRVAIARALIRQPRLVLCDEPTGNLDPATAASVASLLLDLQRHHDNVLIVVTHSDRLAEQFNIRFEIRGGRLERVK
ncbi:MAG TPA: ABC transporter ATP-binding protein [Vicinamibacterales bacterium]|nr:ABC transporter ATP-binding protein [Vicinamibacterales bacterium]